MCARSVTADTSTTMTGGPVPHDGGPTAKAESQNFTPKLGGVAASFAPAATEEGFERVEDAIARRLLPERRLAELEPAMNRLAVGAELRAEMRVIVAPIPRSLAAST